MPNDRMPSHWTNQTAAGLNHRKCKEAKMPKPTKEKNQNIHVAVRCRFVMMHNSVRDVNVTCFFFLRSSQTKARSRETSPYLRSDRGLHISVTSVRRSED